ncbi:MAG TPA: hypothetical protein PKN95_09805 [Verrucomicrobiota bacterium]|nr:hypothetical protein [Verrucomicrobiota bacterium]HNT14657.1 hypothetical protein [Verrucomicrobiota bacterium]
MHPPKALWLPLALILGLSQPSKAAWYDITFDLGSGNTGTGQFEVFTNSPSQFYAASGFLTISGGPAAGNWTLYTDDGFTAYPGRLTSPAGAYWYNNSVYPEGNNPQFPLTNPLLDQYGLLFRLTGNPASELNLWGNADGSYTLGGTVGGGWQNFNVILNVGNGGGPGIVIEPAPEPTAAALFVLGGLMMVATATHRRKQMGRTRSSLPPNLSAPSSPQAR